MPVAFVSEAVASCSFGYRAQTVEKGRVAVRLDDSFGECTCWCCYRWVELERWLVDIDPMAHRLHTALALPNELAPRLELEQLELVACLKPRLVVVVAFLELASGLLSSISNSLAERMAR